MWRASAPIYPRSEGVQRPWIGDGARQVARAALLHRGTALFPYPTLFRSYGCRRARVARAAVVVGERHADGVGAAGAWMRPGVVGVGMGHVKSSSASG